MKYHQIIAWFTSVLLSINILLIGIPWLPQNGSETEQHRPMQKNLTQAIEKRVIKETVTHAPQISKAIIQHPKTTVKVVKTGYGIYRDYKKVNQSVKQVTSRLSRGD
ncbi:hypothetical protein VB712_13080 [Spirulina sp. CCNP1310]|uniref:hypothetical protein n=1 Tax=Spirulina sp. CCNP1310 TaxID=3110249 RepID=UPI002B208220|nr:hypothetical protein [Spirulina sp. CCNP1310]MEA5420157.1 hypothetical protein [Spirulina sp. CCNP1310]